MEYNILQYIAKKYKLQYTDVVGCSVIFTSDIKHGEVLDNEGSSCISYPCESRRGLFQIKYELKFKSLRIILSFESCKATQEQSTNKSTALGGTMCELYTDLSAC